MKTAVLRDGKRVWIDGVTGWAPWERQSSVHAAQETVMRAVGEETSYESLLGVSGLAFRMQLSQEGLCPSSPHPACGFACVDRSIEALPWQVRSLRCGPADVDTIREARRAVVESIERGVPVQYGNEEDGVIVGYQNEGEEWICYHPLRGDGNSFVEAQWPWGVVLFTARKETPADPRALATGALRQAVAMAEAGEAAQYFVGFRAWTEYMARLRALENADEESLVPVSLGNAWIYECLVRYRASAAGYLQVIAGEFDSQAAEHLRRAAELYHKISAVVLSDPDTAPRALAPYPWMLRAGARWDSETRRNQVDRLERSLVLEREAIHEIRAALEGIL